MSSRRAAKFKPLLFTTTVRNPKRLKGFLNILKKYDGTLLNDSLAEEIMGELIRFGLYRPTRVSSEIKSKWGSGRINDSSTIGLSVLTDKEVLELLKNNPQEHKEAGFDRGWPSRFTTEFGFAKELGFVYYKNGEKIEFSKIGLDLAAALEIKVEGTDILTTEAHPELEEQAFLHALAKYQRNNPFVRVANENVPLILLLEVITLLNHDLEYNGAGITKLELPLVIYWKDNDAKALYDRIKNIRKKFGFTPSNEVIADICRNEIMGGNDIVRNDNSIMVDYPDEFIRKMRLTGLISLRGGGRFIDINTNEQAKVDYVLSNYSHYKKYQEEREYFEYVSQVDDNLFRLTAKQVTLGEQDKLLSKWAKIYPWEKIKEELLNLSTRRNTSDEILKFLAQPVRLEFLSALAVKSRHPNIKVVPNYPIDDEGLPTSTAGGNGDKGDIECTEFSNGILIEVTMAEGRTQTMMEVWPIGRHLKKFEKNFDKSMCYFVAPSIYSDSQRQIDFLEHSDGLKVTPKTVVEFLDQLESKNQLLFG